MADDTLRCFTSLLESVPAWIADLDSILQTVADRQAEAVFENPPADADALPALPPRDGSTSSSLRSQHSGGDRKGLHNGKTEHSEVALLRPQPPQETTATSDAPHGSQRKRKSVSVCSDTRSAPPKYRSRSKVVVYYDGELQKKFETLVRAVGSSRNAIRQGKLSARVDSLSRSSSSSSDASSSGGEMTALDLGKLRYRTIRPSTRPGAPLFGNPDMAEAFDKVDGCLERCQTLCEKAAHQVLRDGNCALGLNNARDQLNEARQHAEAELPTLTKKAEKAEAKRRRAEERLRAQEDTKHKDTSSDAVSTPAFPSSVSSLPSDDKLEVDLEADDSDGDEAEFSISTLPLAKHNIGRTRLLAH